DHCAGGGDLRNFLREAAGMPAGDRYDVAIIGTGAGGATLAYRLAPSGKRILLLERGGWLPREKANWDPHAVFVEERYHTTERWYDREGRPFRPGTNSYVGGDTKVYGAGLRRVRGRPSGQVTHEDGHSQACGRRHRRTA